MLKHPVFQLLSAPARNALFSRSKLVSVKRGLPVLERGKVYDHYVVIASGMFKMEMPVHREGGELATVAVLTKGEIVGDDIVGHKSSYESTATVTAVLDSDVMVVPARLLIDTLNANPACVVQMCVQVRKQLERSHRQIARLLGASSEEKVGATLYELAQDAIDTGGSRKGDKGVTQKLVGAVLGMSRESVNKVCKVLEAEGLLHKTADGYVVDQDLAPTDTRWGPKP